MRFLSSSQNGKWLLTTFQRLYRPMHRVFICLAVWSWSVSSACCVKEVWLQLVRHRCGWIHYWFVFTIPLLKYALWYAALKFQHCEVPVLHVCWLGLWVYEQLQKMQWHFACWLEHTQPPSWLYKSRLKHLICRVTLGDEKKYSMLTTSLAST